jgi:hypothetical protein
MKWVGIISVGDVVKSIIELQKNTINSLDSHISMALKLNWHYKFILHLCFLILVTMPGQVIYKLCRKVGTSYRHYTGILLV